MFDRLRQSLALKLAAQYALVFALAAAVMFSALYWLLADSLEKRERAAGERQAAVLAAAYETGGRNGLLARIENSSPDVRSFFVRLLNKNNESVAFSLPPDWVETQVQRIPVPGWAGLVATREINTERIPQDALRDYAITTLPLPDGNTLQVGRLADSRAVLLAPLRRAFAGVGAGALLLSLAVGTVLAWRATRPLRQVSDTARRILETGDLAARVPGPTGSGELAVLVGQLNTLLDKNATHVRLLRETLDNLAHDLRTPLTRLRGTAELALRDGDDPSESRGALADCVDESDRVLHLLEVLLDVSAAEAGALSLRRETVDLMELAARAVELYSEVAEEKNIQVSLASSAPAPFQGDRVRLGQALSNLMDNALKYTPSGGRVAISTARAAHEVVVTVDDTGPGVPVSERESIWRRLYRGDASRTQRGLGLGLSLVRGITEAHGGSVLVTDAPGGGARFQLRFPVVSV